MRRSTLCLTAGTLNVPALHEYSRLDVQLLGITGNYTIIRYLHRRQPQGCSLVQDVYQPAGQFLDTKAALCIHNIAFQVHIITL